MSGSRWFGVGAAAGSDPEAGARAAEDALLDADAKLLIVFCSPAQDLRATVRQIRSRSGDVPLVGCTTAGEIASSGSRQAGVVVAALGGDGFAIETSIATDASADLRSAGARAARCLPADDERPHRVVLLLTDGLAGDQQEVVRGAYGMLGAGIPLVGGCAGDDLRMAKTFQLYNDRVLTNSVIGAGIASDAPLGIGVRHGWKPVGEPMLVTRSGGNRVQTLDDRPALDVYLEHLMADRRDGIGEEDLRRLALTHPLGLSRPTGEEQVRFIGGADFEDRSLECIAEVPQGGLAWIMEGDAQSVLDATNAACQDSVAALAGHPPRGMLAFDCIARRGVLGEHLIAAEIERLSAIGGAPVAGFYTYGEIARTRGIRGFHNQTLVVLSIA
jgi:hypothetical protein